MLYFHRYVMLIMIVHGKVRDLVLYSGCNGILGFVYAILKSKMVDSGHVL